MGSENRTQIDKLIIQNQSMKRGIASIAKATGATKADDKDDPVFPLHSMAMVGEMEERYQSNDEYRAKLVIS